MSARKRGIPVGILRDVVAGARSAQARSAECVRIAVLVERGLPRGLVGSLREALMPVGLGGLVHVERMEPGRPVRVNPDTDLAVVAAATSDGPAAPVARAFASCGIPCAIVVESGVEAPELEGAGGLALIAATSTGVLLDKLAAWMADSCGKPLALAANFPFARHAVASGLVSSACVANAAVGALALVPGADFPIMCATQLRLALDLSCAYGRGLGGSRAAELAGIVAAGLASRSAARALVGMVPAIGWALKASVGYAGTAAMGHALMLRFEGEAAGRGAES